MKQRHVLNLLNISMGIALSAFPVTSAWAQSKPLRQQLINQKYRNEKEVKAQNEILKETQCYTDPSFANDPRCIQLRKDDHDKAFGKSAMAMDCNSMPAGPDRSICEKEKLLDALIAQLNARRDSAAPSTLLEQIAALKGEIQALRNQKATELAWQREAIANARAREKEAKARLAELEKEKLKIENDLTKPEELLAAEKKSAQTSDELSDARKSLGTGGTIEERNKAVKAELIQNRNAQRELYKAKIDAMNPKIKEIDDEKDPYSLCITALNNYSDSAPTDIKTPCSKLAPSDVQFKKAQTAGDVGEMERDRINKYVTQQRQEKLASLKDQKEKEYAKMLSYADDNEECGHSKMAGNSWACQTAHRTAEYGTLATSAAQQVAGIVLQTDVNKNLQTLNAQSVTSDMYETAAKNQDSAADNYNVLKNGAHGVATAQGLAGLTSIIAGVTQPETLNQEARQEHIDAGMKAVMAGVATEATAQGFRIQEELARNAAENNRKIRDGYKGIEDLKIGKNPDDLADPTTSSPFAGLPTDDGTSSQSAAQKDGMTPEQYANSGNLDVPPPSLGNPLNTGGGGGGNNGGFNPPHIASGGGSPAGGPSGGGGGGFFGGGGGGGLSASKEDAAAGEGSHQYAGLMNNPSKYSTGGAGGGSAGGGGNKGVDLSGMLAKFLPGFGGEKKDDKAGKGILAYGKRGPAGQGQGGEYDQDLSQVDRSKSLFDRVHTAYQSKLKERSIGL